MGFVRDAISGFLGQGLRGESTQPIQQVESEIIEDEPEQRSAEDINKRRRSRDQQSLIQLLLSDSGQSPTQL